MLYANRHIPASPYSVLVEGFAGDAAKVTAAGPGLEPEGVVANKPTHFQIFTAGAGKGKPEVRDLFFEKWLVYEHNLFKGSIGNTIEFIHL